MKNLKDNIGRSAFSQTPVFIHRNVILGQHHFRSTNSKTEAVRWQEPLGKFDDNFEELKLMEEAGEPRYGLVQVRSISRSPKH